MSFDDFSESDIEDYSDLIKAVSSISNLFSDSDKPYIDYRLAENMFCRCFGAENLSRSDCSIDARIDRTGIGIKTFLDNAETQKIAEFNKDSNEYRSLEIEGIINTVSKLRNQRLEFTKGTYGVDEMFYHCIIRGPHIVQIIENPMELVSIDEISDISVKNNVISFTDGLHEYRFNKSKSTLYKRFDCSEPLLDVEVEIIDDPFEVLLLIQKDVHIPSTRIPPREHVVLPLYSIRHDKRYVPQKSGLNQWNASGRTRSHDEVYIPIPIRIHNMHPTFFPERFVEFKLRLPDGKTILSAKVCQDNGKALMTNPNSALGEWILRKVLKVPKGELVTYGLLDDLGINSIILYKNSEFDYSIDFTNCDIYEEMMDMNPELFIGGSCSRRDY